MNMVMTAESAHRVRTLDIYLKSGIHRLISSVTQSSNGPIVAVDVYTSYMARVIGRPLYIRLEERGRAYVR